MTYTLDWLLTVIDSGQRPKYLYFWGHQRSKSGDITASCFSQWWVAPFVIDGVSYATAEHWMMAQKARLFDNEDVFQRIIAAKTPAEAKSLGRQVRGFDDAAWTAKRMAIVVRGNFAKFSQHPELREFLLNTNNRVLVEASPVDRIWGIGLVADDERAADPRRWDGLNLLGFALMEVRDRLR
ncbi:NADAR family protein [Hymenobacter sp. ASUV-10]|uniref:NADAR family protein n=1 Tax=Hymenobacter aranciens TaxID=3063996 RepID=A0ABT9BGV3_9BACT|nr:NADAR family protein [Hymenobacter sp. ASUV-10]MDO7877503.1 NADAR family protein [Hymenobacter sp. ASUV-10]